MLLGHILLAEAKVSTATRSSNCDNFETSTIPPISTALIRHLQSFLRLALVSLAL